MSSSKAGFKSRSIYPKKRPRGVNGYATFFNVAFYSQILSALRGGSVSISGGLRLATSRLGPIIAWSLFTGAVGLAIRALEERVGIVGRWIVGLIGVAWSVASVFVVPIIVVQSEGANPVRLLKASAATLKKTWGESLLGYLGLQFGTLLAILGTFALWAAAILCVVMQAWLAAVLLFSFWLVSFVAFVYLMNVASQVYRGALYLYAAEGVIPAPFDREHMTMAWKLKSGAAAEPRTG